MGRKRIPDEIKEARGTLQPCRSQGDDGIERLVKVTPPKWLPPMAKKIFKEKTNILINYRVLTPLDLDNMALYANALADYIEALKILQEQGKYNTVFDDTGRVIGFVENPYLKNMRESVKVITAIGSQYGLSPASRVSITKDMKKDDDKDEFSDFE